MNNNEEIISFNDKGQRHGYWEVYWSNGKLWYKCFYQNDKQVGYEEWYHWNKINTSANKIYNL
jgi:antitoxin component YwqK of YwqJK toxin-antitoxin module